MDYEGKITVSSVSLRGLVHMNDQLWPPLPPPRDLPTPRRNPLPLIHRELQRLEFEGLSQSPWQHLMETLRLEHI